MSCDDGDFDTPGFDLEETVYSCGLVNNEYTLFRLASAESLIVTLKATELRNEITSVPIEVPISETNVIYRNFKDQISESYFCEPIPPLEPVVVSNWTGVSGSTNLILIETVEELNDSGELVGYRHSIELQNLKLENGESYLIFEEGFFGEYVTDL
jgi:hypothetical protein